MTDLATNSQGGDAAVSTTTAGVDANEANLETDIENPDLENPDNLEDDSEEIEHEGTKYRIPKAVKPLLMFQSDYTKKTQEIAERGRTFEEREKSHSEQVKLHQAHLQEIGEIYSLRKAIAPYDSYNWQQAYQTVEAMEDPAQQAKALARLRAWEAEHRQLKEDLAQKSGALKQKFDQQSLEDQRRSAKAIEEAHAAVAREIKDWPQVFDTASKLVVAEFGFKLDEIKDVADPRMLKVLNRLHQGEQAIKKLAALEKAQAANAASPLPQVSSKGTAQQRRTTDASGDGLSTAEWMRRENARELAKRKPN